MCLNCLSIKLESIEEFNIRMNKVVEKTECEGCKNYYKFLLRVNDDLKVLTKTKIKRNCEIRPAEFIKIVYFEGMVKKRITNKLNYIVGVLDDQKEEGSDACYLSRMNEMKSLNDFVADIDEADHN